MIEINLWSLLHEFNGSKFVVFTTLLFFFVLLALKLDGVIVLNFYFIFLPLWFGEFLVYIGFLIGLISFIVSPPPRSDITCRNDFFAMCFCTLEHILLFMFEFLCCYKLNNLQTGAQISWLLVFSPLFVQCLMAMIISVWCIRHEKSYEFEMFFSINVVQFVFIAFKLDRTLHWNWVIVLVPIWVMFALFFVGTFYSLIISIFLDSSIHVFHSRRHSHIYSTICHFLLSIPLFAFFILLSSKLDAFDYWFRYHFVATRVPFVIVGVPLFVALFFLIFLAFGSKSGNVWWFAMRKPFCSFIFDTFPCLQKYANISYKFGNFGITQHVTLPNNGQHFQDLESIIMLRTADEPLSPSTTNGESLTRPTRFNSAGVHSHHNYILGCSIETPD